MANVNGSNLTIKKEQTVAVSPQKKMAGLLERMLPEIRKAVASTMTPERFSRIALSLYSGNAAFWDCDTTSFLSCLMQSAQCGLEPNTVLSEAYLIPYKNKSKGITLRVGSGLGTAAPFNNVLE